MTPAGRAQAITQPDVKGYFRFERVGTEFRFGISVVRPFDNVLLLGSNKALVRSTDEGQTWVPILSPLHRKDITAIVVNQGNIVVGTANGGVYQSTDRGLYWDRFGNKTGLLKVKTLIRVKQGYLALNDGGVCYRKSDADDTWRVITLASPCLDVVRFGDQTWFVCQNGAVLTGDGDEPKLRRLLHVTERTELVVVNNLLAVVLDSVITVLDDNADSVNTWPLPIVNWTACSAIGNHLLIGGRATGLKKLNLETGEATFAFAGPAELENISALAVSGDTVVVGTSRGNGRCYVVSQSLLQWHALIPSSSLSTFDVTDIVFHNGLVYVAAREEGIHVGDANGTLVTPIHDAYEQAVIKQMEPLRTDMLVVGSRVGIWRLKSGTGRLEWFTHTLPKSFDYYATVVGTRVVAGLSEGLVVWTDDDGLTWTRSADTLPRINGMGTIGKSVYVSTCQGLYRSEDKGESWQVVPGPWMEKNVMWATGAQDTLFVTTTDATYRELKGQPVRSIQADVREGLPIPFLSIQLFRGLLFATGVPDVYASTDVGETWQQVKIDRALAVINQFFYNGYYYVFTDTGVLWRSPIP